jgi:hypothetical protein
MFSVYYFFYKHNLQFNLSVIQVAVANMGQQEDHTMEQQTVTGFILAVEVVVNMGVLEEVT